MVDDLRKLRHDLRGSVNILTLCVASLRLAEDHQLLELLDEIIRATDKTTAVLDLLEAIPEHFTADPSDES
jgi:hypothetical protein